MPNLSGGPSCAVVCEYNPFHFGHRWQLSELRKSFGTVICVLGGNLTQRGLPAVADRYLRARAAVACGADLVLELPLPWCCASAADFARGGVSVAERVGAEFLAFSAESEPEDLKQAAERLKRAEADESAERPDAGRRVPYPKRMEDLSGIRLKDRPNDILGLEYLRRLTTAEPFILPRNPAFESSTSIRLGPDPLERIPLPAAEVFRSDPGFPRSGNGADAFLLASLRNEFPETVYAVPEELRAALLRALPDAESVEELADAVKGKMFTVSRVRRALWAAVLRITPETAAGIPPYTLLLAANETGRAYLNSRKTDIPVIARPAALKDDPVFRLNLRANRVLRTVFGGTEPDDLKKRPFFTSSEIPREDP
ncbi:MAG: nucleotidyltransferase family protein [Clostridia bacterium]|nr:nucleotidyltransferase family protein [Clostridia bacterium]